MKQKILKQKKAMHFYNVIEFLFLFTLIILAIGAVFLLMKSNNSYISDDVQTYRSKFKYTQEARTFAETPIKIEGKEMTIAEGLNEIFRIKISRNPTTEEIKKRTKLEYSIKALAEKISKGLDDDEFYAMKAELYNGDREVGFLILWVNNVHSGIDHEIVLPANMGKPGEYNEDYKIILSIKTKY